MASVEENFFEGTEKLLEVWFGFKTDATNGDLRIIPRCEWEELLKLAKCEIISYCKNEDMDAYVLSESSMFVTKDKFILKTCGTTTLLQTIKPLIQLVDSQCGIREILDIFYSRKNFSRPELQIGVHQNFVDEVGHLDKQFRDGAAYTLGRMNKDCWYLYTLDKHGVTQPDQTFELLMWDMCDNRMKIFTKEFSESGADATKKSGICNIIPGAKIDDVLFEPCGYSMNGLLPDGYYFTIHVTPESHCSYVSFESNVPRESYDELIKKVLNIFCPRKFLMTVFANRVRYFNFRISKFRVYRISLIQDHQFCNFKNYNLTYTLFSRPIL
ncbi:hypothetical protein LOTGIDRAFT_205808 [Lottia gigantea]|uniref:adenosylmethionine decarboxylase n=1 Tax=Lottia gigantea TaxID=225164 RepID=V3ZX84_LOTGI|nr:hypothetical protein LOTGIDRAFT_205808 [Lottia gigantea]ESO87235.1 hypothetical protein LOTGIDRAFT_205808 [Lottia gigantea]